MTLGNIFIRRLILPIAAACSLLTGLIPAAAAQDFVIEAVVNTPYVVQFGFGSYNVNGLSVSVYRVPLSHTVPLGAEKDDGELKLTGYLGYGHATFETRLLGPELTASQDYLFLMPQAELAIPLRKGWTLKPYVAAGLGWSFNGTVELAGQPVQHGEDGYSLLYLAGIGSLIELPVTEYRVSLGSKLGWAEVKPFPLTAPGSQSFATFQNGLEVRHPLGVRVGGRELSLAASFIYYFFFPPAEFSRPGDRPLEVSQQFEFGGTLGFAEPTKIWFIDNPQIGVSYRFGDGLTGFRLNVGFPF